ncbi:hypothetical protein G7Y89_g595 [Cudoniella acicularis]|uniref:Gelsolin-like domain-containing protein n=1 Tax=Cudoniella acicularis TaxID=354080 RepID=A0A8H4WAA2_9HELO|nr:hypothetical protein G7Y89_g595 [Cudoniella acicularis]
MPPHDGLTHLKQYDIKDSNVELIGTEIDHRVKHKSAQAEPAWNNGKIGQQAGLYVWRIEDFEVIPWPEQRVGEFYDGDSYIVLHSYKVGEKEGRERLVHDIFFWLGSKTSQDEAGTAAYKTVELDEFLNGVATQHREVQEQLSDEFLAIFPRIKILSGGVQSGFHHVDPNAAPKEITTLLRVFKYPTAGHAHSTVVHEVKPTWESLDEDDVFILDKGDKIWVWQGKKCSPMEKAKAAQVVSDLTLAKHIDVEVLSQTEARSAVVVKLLGGGNTTQTDFKAARPVSSRVSGPVAGDQPQKLFRLSDAEGTLSFSLVKDRKPIHIADFDTDDVFLLDIGRAIWVWRGLGASQRERAMWLNVAHSYVHQIHDGPKTTPIASVIEGNESPAFFKAIAV